MELKAIEVDMFEDIAIDPLVLCSKLKQQQDSTRKKVFAKFNDYEERLEIWLISSTSSGYFLKSKYPRLVRPSPYVSII